MQRTLEYKLLILIPAFCFFLQQLGKEFYANIAAEIETLTKDLNFIFTLLVLLVDQFDLS